MDAMLGGDLDNVFPFKIVGTEYILLLLGQLIIDDRKETLQLDFPRKTWPLVIVKQSFTNSNHLFFTSV